MSFRSELVGSFSQGAAGNPTPVLMEAAFENLGLDWRYVNCEVNPSDLEGAVAGAVAMGWRGFNCSMPHKQSVIPLLASLSETAAITQAVNCVRRDGDEWIGHNTDGVGFVKAVESLVDLSTSHVVLFGSGGAAHAIAVELARAGSVSIVIVSRNGASGAGLGALVQQHSTIQVRVHPWEQIQPAPETTLLVNATPVGSTGSDLTQLPVVWPDHVGDLLVADVVVDPVSTPLLSDAESVGATAIDGSAMLVNQAAENVRLWTGETPDPQPMRDTLDAALGRAG